MSEHEREHGREYRPYVEPETGSQDRPKPRPRDDDEQDNDDDPD